MDGDEKVICPYLDRECIKESCGLWTSVNRLVPGPIVGQAKKIHLEGCAVPMTAILLSMLSSGPAIRTMAKPPPPI